jgi:hypothetical protein
MKHTNIAKTLGWEEVPDNAEGIFLQPEEAAKIDTALATAGSAEESATQLTTAQARVTELEGQLATANTNLTTSQARVTELEAEVKTLGGKSSGTGSTVTATEDEAPKEGKKITLNSPEHPLNVAAKKRVEAARAKIKN